MVRRDSEEGQELTSEECVRAGMYWFGRSDFAAANAWWRRALEIDPGNTRAQECLRLLSNSSSTGIGRSDPVSPFPVVRSSSSPALPLSSPDDFAPEPSSENLAVLTAGDDGEPSVPMNAFEVDAPPAMVLDPSGDLRDEGAGEGPSGSRDLPPVSDRPHGTQFPFYDDPDPDPDNPTDAFDFAAVGQARSVGPTTPARNPLPPSYVSPWDDGPSRTSVVTLDSSDGDYDAVPDPTPLPAIDREHFFGRSDAQTPEEIVDEYLRVTGDLPYTTDEVPPATSAKTNGVTHDDARDGPGILIDDPIEFEEDGPQRSAPSAPDRPTDGGAASILAEGKRRYQLHDFGGALEVLGSIPPDAPEAAEARNLSASSQRQMLKMYESKIGDFDQVPRIRISNAEVIWLNLDHRAGFILSQIDGSVTFEDIISLSGMPRLDTVRILSQLLADGVIGVGEKADTLR